MLPKSEYMKLSKTQKQAVKRKLVKKNKKKTYNKKNIGGRIGRFLGNLSPYAPNIAAELGELAGNKIASVFGPGDYHITNPTNNALLDAGDSPPQFNNNGHFRTTTVRHREYIGDIYSSTGFNINGYNINPGLGSTFPWLSSVAGNYECYRLKGMLFEFKSMSSNALTSTNTALGTVIMATQYNAADASFVSKQQMENYEFAQSCKPAESMCHYIECAKNTAPLSELYIRNGTVPQGQTQQIYDIGKFFIATTGMQAANVNIGELWVTYEVDLLKPKLIQGQYGDGINYYNGYLGNGISTSNYFSGLSPAVNNNIKMLF